jgi:transposase
MAQRKVQVAALLKRVEQLEAELAKAKKSSRNSSKPPSSDIVNPKKRKAQRDQARKRETGGQPGHRRHERTAIPGEQVDHHWEWRYDACPCCGGGLEEVGESRVHQQIELSEISTTVEQHDFVRQHCAHCDKVFSPQIPEDLCKAGLFGPRLTALVEFLKGACG